MEHNITHYAKTRHTTKAYDASKKISPENAEKLKELLRFSPSSTNAQPWHFILASTDEGKQKVAKGAEIYGFNKQAILDASHVVVFCTRLNIEKDYLDQVLEQEDKDGRFTRSTSKETMDGARHFFINMHKHDYKDVQHWMDKQVYLNIGQFMLGAATLGIDTTPMEGIEVSVIDEEFGLREKGYTALAAVCLGYHHESEDYNAKLPKSRLPYSEILTEV